MAAPHSFLVSLNLEKNELQNAVIQNLATAPSTPVAGQLYFNTTDGTLYVYDGVVWSDALGSSDVKDVKVSANDTTPGFLEDKLAGTGGNVSITVLNDGANETIRFVAQIDASDVISGTFADARIALSNVTQHINDAGTGATDIWSADKIASEISTAIASAIEYKGGYDANTNTPDLDTSPSGVLKGDMYTVTAGGTFFTETVSTGDVLIAEIDNPTVLGDWTIVERNLNSATETSEGIVELATQAEVDAGTDTTRVITPATLASNLSTQGFAKTYTQTGITIGTVAGLQTITHNLGVKPVQITVIDSTTFEEYTLDVKHPTINTTTIDANGAAKTVDITATA